MNATEQVTSPEQVAEHSRGKSPGRVAAMKRVNEAGLNGMGGRRPVHGRKALAELLKRGWESGGEEVAAFAKDRETAYLSDLGGPGNCSEMDRAVVRRMVGLDLDWLLLTAQTDRAAKMPLERRLMLAKARNSNAVTHAALIKVIGGPGRRPAETSGTVTIRRFAETETQKEENENCSS